MSGPSDPAARLVRPRLRRLLPEEGGRAVWLRAPAGFGKSVLLRQWAVALAREGWTVGPGPALPGGPAPRAVWIDDADLVPPPSWLADGDPRGVLLLLASRGEVAWPALARWRLSVLGAGVLALTPDEARALLGEAGPAAWARTLGWPAPLVEGGPAPWDGVRSGLPPDDWAELLAASAAGSVRAGRDDGAAPRLAEAGLLLADGDAWRPHPLAADLPARFPDETGAALRRLPPFERAVACERLGRLGELAELLEDTRELAVSSPGDVRRWDALLPPGGVGRALTAAWAHARGGHPHEAGRRFLAAARDPRATPEQRLDAYGNAAFYLANADLDAARGVAAEAGDLVDGAAPTDAARLLARLSNVDYQAGDLARGVARLERAQALLGPDAPDRLRASVAVNLAMQRWVLRGDTDAHLAVRERELREAADLSPAMRLDHRWNLGVASMLGGRLDDARRHFALALDDADANPLAGLQAEAQLALLERRFDDLPALWARLAAFRNPDEEEHVLAMWAFALVGAGRAREALDRIADRRGAYLDIVRPLVLHAAGRGEEALVALPDPPDPVPNRVLALVARAVRFRVTRDPAELDALLDLTVERERPLAFLVPLADLPRDRPDLARAHPLAEVLASGWKDAVRARLPEVPPLRLRLLGAVEVRVLGAPVALTARPRDLLVLLALGLPRDLAAEALWPGADPEKSRNNLHVTLNALRRVLEPWGVPTYLLEGGLVRVENDLDALRAALDGGDWDAARRLYGELAPGVELDAVAAEREALRERVLGGVTRDAAARDGDDPDAEDALEWVLERDPLREDALAALLGRLARAGRRVSAERRYRDYARRLRDELGLEPGPALRRALEGEG